AAEPGHELGYAGSRLHWIPGAPEGWALLVGDETGLPALSAIAEGLPAGMRAIALVEVEDAGERQPIDSAADLDLRWLYRDGAPAGETTLLADAVRELELPDGPGRAWGGGEALAMRDVRRHLKDERGLPGQDTQILGYWKHRATESWE
ncbi:MAG TPA: siderophore-interacting protein, partial [Thermoleophilaceae bacterium]|nr:siderophore-interacting protein [Thermoleophilaceae bacterium]